ncbi:hypothetical protein C9374_010590 [Naegleria lovaniensis]|uniref:Uncharacterized protein n=1 Tax=Naegleria lovaniensis TaxID=51637 RepID=A0AA88KG24_NAELO|nr:uncharacterized protein C9374_010590 [Naegleria lovaniensis]KAG2374571.1 hypothetical protein C9374_010590 [Naegleria lovaniensis]
MPIPKLSTQPCHQQKTFRSHKVTNSYSGSTHTHSDSLISLLSCFGVKVNLRPIKFAIQQTKDKPTRSTVQQIKEQLQISSNDHPISITKNLHDELFRIKFSTASIGHYHSSRDYLTLELYKQIETSLEKSEPIDVMTIEIEFLKASPSDLLKYFSSTSTQSIEEQLLNQLVEILDVDEKRKHVYIRIRRDCNHNTSEIFDPIDYRYLLMGKIDSSNHAFLFDVSGFSQNDKTVPKSVDHLYELCTPANVRNKSFQSDDNNDCGIQRILIGCFLTSMTTTKRKNKRGGPIGTKSLYYTTNPYHLFKSQS